MWTLREYDTVDEAPKIKITLAAGHTEKELSAIQNVAPVTEHREFSTTRHDKFLEVPGDVSSFIFSEDRVPDAPRKTQFEKEEEENARISYSVAKRLVELTDTVEFDKDKSDANKKKVFPPSLDKSSIFITNPVAPIYARFPTMTLQSISDTILKDSHLIPDVFPNTTVLSSPIESNTTNVLDLESGLQSNMAYNMNDLNYEKKKKILKDQDNFSCRGSILNGGLAGDALELFLELNDRSAGYTLPMHDFNFFLRIFQKTDSIGTPSTTIETILLQPCNKTYLKCEVMFRCAGGYQLQMIARIKDDVDQIDIHGIQHNYGNTTFYRKVSSTVKEDILLWGEPHNIIIYPGPAFGPNCQLNCGHLNENGTCTLSITPGIPESLLLITSDQFGNPCQKGDDIISVSALGAIIVKEVIDRHNGEYEIQIFLPTLRQFAICGLLISLNHISIKGSPIELTCLNTVDKEDKLNRPFSRFSKPMTQPHYSEKLHLSIPPTAPPGFDLLSAKRVLPPGYTSLLIPAMIKQMDEYEDDLLQHYTDITKAWKDNKNKKETNMPSIDMTALKLVELNSLTKKCDKSKKDIHDIQQKLQTIYTCLQLNTVASLPIIMEIEDAESVREYHRSERDKLKDIQHTLQHRVQDMKAREIEVVQKREELADTISAIIAAREQSIKNQTTYLGHLIHKIEKKNLQTLKRQLRREDRDACEGPAVIALQSEHSRRDLSEKILTSRLRDIKTNQFISKKEPIPLKETVPIKSLPLRQITPDNPRNPSFWIAEGKFRSLPWIQRQFQQENVYSKTNDINNTHELLPTRSKVLSPSMTCHPSKLSSVTEMGCLNNTHESSQMISISQNKQLIHPISVYNTSEKDINQSTLHLYTSSKIPKTGVLPPMKPPRPSLTPPRVSRMYHWPTIRLTEKV